MLTTNTIERFGGIARLYGEKALQAFTKSHVCVVGIGGVGSWAVEALARSGVGKITMIDLDDICVTNINRQLHAMDGAIGKQKTDAMAERVKAINPECEIICLQRFFTEQSSAEILSTKFDFIIDAMDHVRAKCHLVDDCKKLGIPLVVCGSAGGLTDPTQIQVADLSKVSRDGMLKKLRTQLRTYHGFPKATNKKAKKFNVECIYSTESPVFPQCDGSVSHVRQDEDESMNLNCSSGFGSITHMTATVGLFAVQRCLRKLSSDAIQPNKS